MEEDDFYEPCSIEQIVSGEYDAVLVFLREGNRTTLYQRIDAPSKEQLKELARNLSFVSKLAEGYFYFVYVVERGGNRFKYVDKGDGVDAGEEIPTSFHSRRPSKNGGKLLPREEDSDGSDRGEEGAEDEGRDSGGVDDGL